MTVLVSATAAAEALAAEARLDREQPGYGQAFTALFGQALRAIEATPRLFARTEDGPDGVETREVFIERFEYRVIYAFPADDTAEVIAVIHARRRPGAWVGRVN